MRQLFASLVQLAGLVSVTFGTFMLSPAFGFLVLGAALILIGLVHA